MVDASAREKLWRIHLSPPESKQLIKQYVFHPPQFVWDKAVLSPPQSRKQQNAQQTQSTKANHLNYSQESEDKNASISSHHISTIQPEKLIS